MTERREEKARLKRTASMLPNNGTVWVTISLVRSDP